jgi:hypothetical protein
MIPVTDLISRIRTRIDAVDSGYYDDVDDIIPAIQSSIEWLVSLINANMSDKKISEESLRELRVACVFQTSVNSRINIDSTFWSIEAVYPLPLTGPTDPPTILINPHPEQSLKRSDLLHKKGSYSAKRMTLEEWAENEQNPFAAGNTVKDCCVLTHGSSCNIKFGYLNPLEYRWDDNFSNTKDLEVRPYIPSKLCTLFYIENPAKITSTSDEIRFPLSIFEIIVDKALQFLSYRQGDGTTIWQVSGSDVNQLIQMLS